MAPRCHHARRALLLCCQRHAAIIHAIIIMMLLMLRLYKPKLKEHASCIRMPHIHIMMFYAFTPLLCHYVCRLSMLNHPQRALRALLIRCAMRARACARGARNAWRAPLRHTAMRTRAISRPRGGLYGAAKGGGAATPLRARATPREPNAYRQAPRGGYIRC